MPSWLNMFLPKNMLYIVLKLQINSGKKENRKCNTITHVWTETWKLFSNQWNKYNTNIWYSNPHFLPFIHKMLRRTNYLDKILRRLFQNKKTNERFWGGEFTVGGPLTLPRNVDFKLANDILKKKVICWLFKGCVFWRYDIENWV